MHNKISSEAKIRRKRKKWHMK